MTSCDGGTYGFEILWLKDQACVAWSLSFFDGGGEHTGVFMAGD